MRSPDEDNYTLALDDSFNEKQIVHLLRVCHRIQNITFRNVRITDGIAQALALTVLRQKDSLKSLTVDAGQIQSKRGLFLICNSLEDTDCVAELSLKPEFVCEKDISDVLASQSNCKLTLLSNDDIASKVLLLHQLINSPGFDLHDPDYLKLFLRLE